MKGRKLSLKVKGSKKKKKKGTNVAILRLEAIKGLIFTNRAQRPPV